MRTLAALALLTASLTHAGDFKAAYVDFNRALVEVDEGKAARARLQTKAEARKKELETEKAALEKDGEAYKKQEPMMDDKTRREKGEALLRRQSELADKAQRAQLEMNDAERKEMSTIIPRFETILAEIAQREGLTMIFDKVGSGLAWAPPSLDLTNELIRTYNTRKSTTPKAGAAGATTDAPKK